MTDAKFRKPSEMAKTEPRVPVSARLKESTKASLDNAAKEHGLSVGELVSNVLDDYVTWLSHQKSKRRKG